MAYTELMSEIDKFIAEFKHRVKDDCFLLRKQSALGLGFLRRKQ